jgi:CIC family chloride channel protein
MAKSVGSFLRESAQDAAKTCRGGWRVLVDKGPSQFQFWLIALAIGIGAGFGALAFRKAIHWLQSTLYGTEDLTHLHSFAGTLSWYWLLLIPMGGGLAVGLILHFFTPDGRARSVADVIQGAAL